MLFYAGTVGEENEIYIDYSDYLEYNIRYTIIGRYYVMKRAIVLILSCIMLSLVSFPIYAVESDNGSKIILVSRENPEHPIILNVKEKILPVKSSSMMSISNNAKEYAKEFEVSITEADLARAAGTHSDTVYDSSGGVKLWGRVTFDRNGESIVVTKIEGNSKIEDSSLSTFNHHVIVSSMGAVPNGQWKEYDFTTRGFSYLTGFNKFVNPKEVGAQVGGNFALDIKRSGNPSSWHVLLDLHLNGAVPLPDTDK